MNNPISDEDFKDEGLNSNDEILLCHREPTDKEMGEGHDEYMRDKYTGMVQKAITRYAKMQMDSLNSLIKAYEKQETQTSN